MSIVRIYPNPETNRREHHRPGYEIHVDGQQVGIVAPRVGYKGPHPWTAFAANGKECGAARRKDAVRWLMSQEAR